MTLLQEAYKKINSLPEEKIKQVIIFVDLLENSPDAVIGKQSETLSKSEKMNKFLSTAGEIQIDAQSISALRERSMI